MGSPRQPVRLSDLTPEQRRLVLALVKAAQSAELVPTDPAISPVHGRRSTYVKGCRCALCRAANAREHAEWAARARPKSERSPDRSASGRAGALKRWGPQRRSIRLDTLSDDARRRILDILEETPAR